MSALRRPDRARAEKAARSFNAMHPLGTKVRYWRGKREGLGSEGITRSEAYVTDSGEAVLFIEGCSGFIALSHIQPIAS